MVYVQPRILPGEWDAQSCLEFWETNISPNLGKTTRHCDNQSKKRICQIVNFAVLPDHRVKIKESEKRDKYLDLPWEVKKTMEHESDGDTSCIWCARSWNQKIGIMTGRLRKKKRPTEYHPTYSIVEIGLNTEKSPRDLRKLDAIHTPGRNH